jgi:PTH1 family peptidyl-tRNA hydrolase
MVLQWFRRFFANKEPATVPVQKILVGLGNRGSRYAGTRHNVGFATVDAFIQTTGQLVRQRAHYQSDIAVASVDKAGLVVCAQPRTFMNRSGFAIQELVTGYRVALNNCLVIVDDYNLPLGQLRFRAKGSDGGHNGLKSIIAQVGEDFPRLRLGIGPLPSGNNVIDFVLGRFAPEELAGVSTMIGNAAEAALFFCVHGIEKAMNHYNKSGKQG